MSAIRRISLSAAALFLSLSALFVVGGTATAAVTSSYAMDCGEDWNTTCP